MTRLMHHELSVVVATRLIRLPDEILRKIVKHVVADLVLESVANHTYWVVRSKHRYDAQKDSHLTDIALRFYCAFPMCYFGERRFTADLKRMEKITPDGNIRPSTCTQPRS